MTSTPTATREDIARAALGRRGDVSLAAQLCWHAAGICRALDRGVTELQVALAEAAEHADAVIELAITLPDGLDKASCSAGEQPS